MALLNGLCSEAHELTHQAKNKTQKSSFELVMFGKSLTCIEKVACDSQSGCLFMSLVIFEKFCPRHSVLSEILSLSNEHSDTLMFDQDLQTQV